MRMKSKSVLIALALILFGFVAFGKEAKAAAPYLIKINKQQCVVTIYEQDKQGKFTKPIKAFVCSPGNATPLGTFSLKEKIRWHELDGPTYGQYCSRIVDGVLFHSVWYYKPQPDALSLTQYNNLGYRVSHGCVRLCVRDAKWIYENCSSGTTVVIYNSKNPGPLGKPISIKVPGYSGWDPTDIWSSGNPWNKKKPSISGAENGTVIYASKFDINKGIKVKNTTGMDAKKLLEVEIFYKKASGKFKKVTLLNTKKPGVYKITYKITDEIGRKAKVTIRKKVLTKVAVRSITLKQTKKTLYLGGTKTQAYTTINIKNVLPKTASIQAMEIISSNKAVATVNNKGKVTAKSAGECTITFLATDGSGVKAECQIIVKQKATGITLKASTDVISVGESLELTAEVLPKKTTNKTVSFTSSDSAVATVDANGKVTAISPGVVSITVATKDGSNRTATLTLTVASPEPVATEVPQE